jgi:hypothetical protein
VKLLCTSRPYGCRFFGTEGWIDSENLNSQPKSVGLSTIGADEIHLYESRNHMSNFIECIRTRRPTVAPVEVGHRSATVCHLGNIAMTLKRRLRWDPQAEQFLGDDEANRMLWRPYREPYTL